MRRTASSASGEIGDDAFPSALRRALASMSASKQRPTRVRPAGGLQDRSRRAAGFVELVVPAVGIGLQHAGPFCEMHSRMLAATVNEANRLHTSCRTAMPPKSKMHWVDPTVRTAYSPALREGAAGSGWFGRRHVTYAVKEIFKTLQGEGGQAGRAAVFCRYAGCNLWSGREEDRAWAQCRFCDTDFVGTDGKGGGHFKNANELAAVIDRTWGDNPDRRYVVFTGGEPLLQLDAPLLDAVRARGFMIAVETNGTIAAPPGIDWICVSPKAGNLVKQTSGQELKLVYPQDGVSPETFAQLAFENFFLQPMDGPQRLLNTQLAVEYCLENPRWRVSLQTHKLMGIP